MTHELDTKSKGAWLLAQSKSLDAVSGAGRLENIQYAGRTGRLYNLLRRNVQGVAVPTIGSDEVKNICQLNGIDRAAREAGLQRLQEEGRIDRAAGGSVAVIGATATAVLETTASIFDSCEPSDEEEAVLHLSEMVAQRPSVKAEVISKISDLFDIRPTQASELIDVCKLTAIVDEAEDKGRIILFNNNTFRDAKYARKAYHLMEGLTVAEQSRLKEVQALLSQRGAVHDQEAHKILGGELYSRLVGVGLFDRLEVSNSTEAVGYLTSPDSFQKYGRPFEDDPIDDAKALLASLTYGMTRSTTRRGNITMPAALLRKLIEGDEVGGPTGVQAIGEDYRELEKRQVVKVTPKRSNRFTMKLLKKDVGELALTIVQGGVGAAEAMLMDGSAARNFKGPAETRRQIRQKHTLNDAKFITGALDRLRSGG